MTRKFRKCLFTILVMTAPLVPGLAHTGDAARLNTLGFSPDGGIFAFEEYGVQDGSGFPYANRFYIDIATDQFIAGSPVRVLVDDEIATVETARTQAQADSQSIIADAVLIEGNRVGTNETSEMSADPFRMAVNPRPVVPAIDDALEVRLIEKQFAPVGVCEGMGAETIGFKLVKVAVEPGTSAELLHDDTSVPSSRNCATGYSIGAIETFFPPNGAPVYAVLIAVRSFGFEGPDFRWLAVTAQMDDMR